jgi:chromosome segregation ATPase
VAAARTTAEYARPHIPEPPRDELELDIVIDVGAQRAQEAARQTAGHAATTSSAPKPSADGLLGVRRWRRRFDAIRGALDELAVVQPAPAEIERAMAFAAHTLEKLEDSVVVVESRQASLESIGERARDFRSTLGGMVDELASELSRRRGELEVLVGHRRELVTKREALRESARSGTANEGEADALIWELAAVDEELRAKTTQCDELEAQLGELRARLERENERSEAEIAALVRFLDADMQRLERLAEALRAPLDRAEAYVRETWEKRAALDPTPASSH